MHNGDHPILGKTVKQKAEVLQYLSFATSDFMSTLMPALSGLMGRVPYNKKHVEEAIVATNKLIADHFESRLANYTYLVGERLTVADLFVATCFLRPFQLWLDAAWRKDHPAFMRWWYTVTSSEYLNYFEFTYTDKKVKPPMPEKKKKDGKKNESKKQAKKEAAPPPPAEPKKAKHPIEALGKSTIPIDNWKREYSNEETREVALPYFWNEFYNPEEWSLWKVGYKYNDELTLTFMSNNLVGGFFTRLTASIKYMFGCMVVYGENNNNGIIGAFVIRGQDYKAAFDVAPDWESYEFTKLDGSKEEDRDFVNNMWAWDQPVIVNGEKKEIADGKVLK